MVVNGLLKSIELGVNMKLYFWLKSHGWRIAFWTVLVLAFVGAYTGGTWQERLIHAFFNTIGVLGIMFIGELAFCEKMKDEKEKELQELNARIK